MLDPAASPFRPHRLLWFVILAGAYLTLRGYHSFDGDQSYRLPILLHWQDPSLYAADPFVRAFDTFNPHRGYLAILQWASIPLGLATALFGLFVVTLAVTMTGVDRLARAVWPHLGSRVGLVAVTLVLAAKAGNIGTNHLFEATLLDRLLAFGFGWLALAAVVADPGRGVRVAAPCLGLATLIHPSVGLQIALTLATAWVVWACRPRITEVSVAGAVGSVLVLALALIPGLILVGGQSGRLLVGMPLADFREWAVRVQGPQHMLPSTWRLAQWLAFGSYPTLTIIAYLGRKVNPAGCRFWHLLAVNLMSLTLAYVAVDVIGDLRATLFQPFRMVMLARGLCLVAVAGHLVSLWDRGDLISRGRVVVIIVGLTGDWALVVATLVEVAATLTERLGTVRWAGWLGGLVLVLGLIWLSRHDTESGQVVLLAGLGVLLIGTGLARIRPIGWNRRRVVLVLIAAWAVPVAAWGAGIVWGDRVAEHPVGRFLVGRCRLAEVPVDPAERVAAWCRVHTPAASRFVIPPGEKDFRLWSRRAVAFNRAASPYHAAGLLDWSERFRAHVGFTGTSAEFARAYLAGRHNLERGFDRMTPAAKLALAQSQGADYVLERSGSGPTPDLGPGLELIHAEGGYAVYRVR